MSITIIVITDGKKEIMTSRMKLKLTAEPNSKQLEKHEEEENRESKKTLVFTNNNWKRHKERVVRLNKQRQKIRRTSIWPKAKEE